MRPQDYLSNNMNKVAELIPIERIQNFIFLIRGEKVMLDSHLVELYGVDTGALNRAVKRNSDRFPEDFMFQLSADEMENLKCQIGISSFGHGGRRRSIPYVFTEQGVAMLSNVNAPPRPQKARHQERVKREVIFGARFKFSFAENRKA